MRAQTDSLYSIFEQNLFNALVEDETTAEFLHRVVKDYLSQLAATGTIVPKEHVESVEDDLREEVLEMLRKKTYGYFNLSEFRKHNQAASAQETSDSSNKKARVLRAS